MSDHDIELLKLQIQREQAARDFWKWAIMYVLLGVNPLVNLLSGYFQHQATTSVAAKVDANATKTDAVLTASDASIKNWKAYNSKEPGDMSQAQEALDTAERRIIEAPQGKQP